jgi:AAA family ATP:ADP antiporter
VPLVTAPWQRLFRVKAGELVVVTLACAYFFCVLACNYILRPVRDEMGIQRGSEGLTWLMTGTLIVTVLINPVFSLLVGRTSRRWFIPVTYQFFAANLALFYLALQFYPHRTAWLQDAFFIWMSVFNLFIVSVFWAFMSDLFTSEQGKRLYPLIGVGGTLGAIFGSQLTSALVELVGPPAMLLVAAGMLELAIVCMLLLDRQAPRGIVKRETVERSMPWDGVVLIFRRPYLALMVLYMVLQTSLATLLYFQQAGILEDWSSDPKERTQLLADLNTWVNLVTLGLQLFVSSHVLSKLGVTRTLLIAPAVLLVAFAGLSIESTVVGARDRAGLDPRRRVRRRTARPRDAVHGGLARRALSVEELHRHVRLSRRRRARRLGQPGSGAPRAVAPRDGGGIDPAGRMLDRRGLRAGAAPGGAGKHCHPLTL